MSILLGDGLGGFSSTAEIGVGDFPVSVAVGEFNADGAADLAVANEGRNSVSILLGDGAFFRQNDRSAASYVRSIRWGVIRVFTVLPVWINVLNNLRRAASSGSFE